MKARFSLHPLLKMGKLALPNVQTATFLILAGALFTAGLLAQAVAGRDGLTVHQIEDGRAQVKIIARGETVVGSDGNMDRYLAVVSSKRREQEMPVILVHYYPFIDSGLSEEAMNSGRILRLKLRYAPYCSLEPNKFVVRKAFDAEAVSRLQSETDGAGLPCYRITP
jgi:hypothetical protein